jgi:hypothetical protein
MPFYLRDVDVVPEVAKFNSALIVLCRFCPAASMAVRKQQPYIEFFRRFVNTESYEQLISEMQSRLEKDGVKTDVFKGNLLPMPLNFIICMWTAGQRQKLLRQASQYEAVVVMGCESVYKSECDILASTDCQVFQGMESEGVFDVTPRFNLPFKISLELNSVTPVLYPETQNGKEVSS